jgi:hypothetical protein
LTWRKQQWTEMVKSRFFYAIMSFLNVLAFFVTLSKTKERAQAFKEFTLALFRLVLQCFISMPKGILWTLVGIFWAFPQALFRCLPISFKSKVRFGRRYAVKTGLGLEQKCELGITELKDVYRHGESRRSPRYKGGPGERSPLSDFLGTYDMLITVSEEMHYSDIMNLSRVSKSVREAVLPAHDLTRRLEIFRRYTCTDGLKTDCWVCDKSICTVSRIYCFRKRATFVHRPASLIHHGRTVNDLSRYANPL